MPLSNDHLFQRNLNFRYYFSILEELLFVGDTISYVLSEINVLLALYRIFQHKFDFEWLAVAFTVG